MPTYEYRCPDGHDFEQFVLKMSDGSSELPCPECGKAAARRMSAGGGLLFKGSGFYITDYGKDGKKDQRDDAAAKATASAKAESAKAEGSSKSDSAPAAPAGGKSESGAKSESATKPATPAPAASTPPPKSSGNKE